MGKNRNPWFKVMPGDDERMLRGVDVQAIGLLHRLRCITHDSDPYGFLVDFRRQPLNLEKLADTFGMTNGRFRAIFNELRERQIIQNAAEYAESLSSHRSAWATKKVQVYAESVRGFETPLSEIY